MEKDRPVVRFDMEERKLLDAVRTPIRLLNHTLDVALAPLVTGGRLLGKL